jgi:uncharacterized protein (TIGR02246 family)
MTDIESEIAAITQVVAAIEHAQRNELVDEFVALFREDAIWTTGGGKLLIGRDTIAVFTRKVLPGAMKGLVPSYQVMSKEDGQWRLTANQNTSVAADD